MSLFTVFSIYLTILSLKQHTFLYLQIEPFRWITSFCNRKKENLANSLWPFTRQSLSVCLSVCLLVLFSVFFLPVRMSEFIGTIFFLFLFFFYFHSSIAVCLSVCLSICLFVCLLVLFSEFFLPVRMSEFIGTIFFLFFSSSFSFLLSLLMCMHTLHEWNFFMRERTWTMISFNESMLDKKYVLLRRKKNERKKFIGTKLYVQNRPRHQLPQILSCWKSFEGFFKVFVTKVCKNLYIGYPLLTF